MMFTSRKEAKEAGWHSRRNRTSEAQSAERLAWKTKEQSKKAEHPPRNQPHGMSVK